MVAHIAGIPIEETVLGLAPVAMVVFGGIAVQRKRVGDWLRRRSTTMRAPAR